MKPANLLAALVVGAASCAAIAGSDPIGGEAADWVVRAAGRTVFGSDHRVVLGNDRILEMADRVSSAAVVGRRLFLASPGGTLASIDLTITDAQPVEIALKPPVRGAIHLAGMQGALVIAEDGFGIRVLPVGGVSHGAHHCGGEGLPTAIQGILSLDERFGGLSATGSTIRAAVPGKGIVEVDARDLPSLRVARTIAGPGDAVALADDGARLFELGPRGLSVRNLDALSSPPREQPEVRGTALSLAGRRVWVATGAGGLVGWTDTSRERQLFVVIVSDSDFTPDALTVNVGDTVRWTNDTGDLHNVFACTTDQLGCDGIAADEPFPPSETGIFWSHDYTFMQPGSNPYVCQPHATFMSGTVEVTGTPAGLPAVPDGTTGTAMKVTRLSADGSLLAVHWDTSTCPGAADYQLVFGHASQLPISLGGTYGLDGAECAIGTDAPITWASVPPVTQGGSSWLWWLVVATDGSATEGPWGRDGAGDERDGPAGSGSSGQCGMTVKDLTGSCP